MEEGNSDKNTEIDWKNAYDEQMSDNGSKSNIDDQNLDQQQNTTQIKPIYNKKKSNKKKVVIIIIIVILLYSSFVFISTNQPGIFIPTLILSICIWQFGKSPKKKPYEYVYEDIEQIKDDGKIHEIQPSYLPNTRYDQSYIPAYGIPVPTQKATLVTTPSKTKLYKDFQKAAEYNTNWLNVETQTLNVDPDDEIILSHWTPLRLTLKTSIGDSIKNFLMLVLFFGIYALITYFLSDDRANGNFDATFQAFFLPIVPYILVCYRKFDKYIKAIFYSILLLAIISILMSEEYGLITSEGIPFLKYFGFIESYYPQVDTIIENLPGLSSGDIGFTIKLLVIVFAVEFIIMVLYSIVKTRPYVSMVISRKAVFIRAKTKKSYWDIAVIVFWIIFNPFNISQYKDITERIRYNRMTAKEGRYHDFSKIEPGSISSLKKKKYNTGLLIALSIVIMIIGIYSLFVIQLIFGAIILGIGIIFLLNAIKKKDKYKIIINVTRSQIEGSWILSHKSDIFRFERVSPS
ncbi:MAG: hypothetical protein ACTSWD_16265, partial [Candidatus Heimdallarchaeota archaeon]